MSYLKSVCRLAVLGGLILGSVSVAMADDVRWRGDYKAAQAEAVRLKRPIMIVVTSEGCGWCRKLERTTLRDARVVQELNEFTIPFRLDADDSTQAALVEALGVDGVPAIAFVNPGGKLIANRPGYLDAAKFLRFVQGMREPKERSK